MPALFITLILLVTAIAGYIYYHYEKQSVIGGVIAEMHAITELKADQLARIYEDETNDIALIASNRSVADLYARWQRQGKVSERDRLMRLLASLTAEHGYRELFICNGRGERFFPESGRIENCNPRLRAALMEASERGTAISTDLYWCERHKDVHLDFLAPIDDGSESRDAVIVGRFSAAESIYPIMRHWPSTAKSAESYLIRKEADSVRIVSPLRVQGAPMFNEAFGLKERRHASVIEAARRGGSFEATGHRGIDVIGYARPVISTPWILVTEIDRSEVIGKMHTEIVLLVALFAAITLTVIAGTSHFSNRRQSRLYRAMFEDHAAIKFLIDTKSGRIVDANAAAARYYGWSREQLREMNIDQINTLPPDEVKNRMRASIVKGMMRHEFQHRCADGSVRDVEVFAGALRIRGRDMLHSIVVDVSEKKEAERSIRLLGRSVEQSPVTVVITNSDGEIEYVNPEFTRVTGYAAEEVIGRKTNVLGSGHHNREFYAELWSTILSGRDWTGEFLNRRKDGEEFWERAIISPVFDTKGTITHFLGVKSDITDEKRLLSELLTAKERAEESDRLKSAFLANMSHEIRTPINTVVGFADLLNDSSFSHEEREEFAAVIRQRSYDLLNIINDILDISRIEAGVVKIVMEECRIDDILHDLLVMFTHHALNQKKTGLRFTCENELVGDENLIVTDAARIRQVMTNLLSNAFKFTSEGRIVFGCRKTSDSQILFYVTDTGIGIDADASGIIFDRFRQADESSSRRYGGTGLGLAICQGIVQLLGGRIWVESEPGKGSTFQFTLPGRNHTASNPDPSRTN